MVIKRINSNISLSSLTGGIIMSIILEVSDSIKNNRTYYLEEIYNSAKMSVVRNLVENFQSRMLEKINEELEHLPVDAETLREIRLISIQDSRKPFDEDCFKDIKFHAALPFYYELINNVSDLIERKREENEKISNDTSYDLVNTMLERITEVDQIPEESLESPSLFSDLAAMFKEYLNIYSSTVQGTVKRKNISFNKIQRQVHC